VMAPIAPSAVMEVIAMSPLAVRLAMPPSPVQMTAPAPVSEKSPSIVTAPTPFAVEPATPPA